MLVSVDMGSFIFCLHGCYLVQRVLFFLCIYDTEVLQRAACGMGLRAADPAAMKEFVVVVQQRTAELKASLSGNNNGKPVDLGKRVGLIFPLPL